MESDDCEINKVQGGASPAIDPASGALALQSFQIRFYVDNTMRGWIGSMETARQIRNAFSG